MVPRLAKSQDTEPKRNFRCFEEKFRRRFCLPFSSFLEMVEEFPRWTRRRRKRRSQSPLELLLLGSLRYLGRGFTFDDLEECTAISEEIHRVFFHQFIKLGSTVLFEKYVITPATHEELQRRLTEFEMTGMPGATASVRISTL